MSIMFERLSQDQDAIGRDRRKVARTIVSAAATLSTAHGDRVEVILGDVSTHGCNIRSDVDWLKCGRFVSIGLGNDPPVQAIIRWVRHGASGLEFLQPLGEACTEWHMLIHSGWDA